MTAVSDTPRISVIVPTRRGDAPVARSTVAAQTIADDVELVVADGFGSPAAGRNAGAARARGRILVFLDDDVPLEPPEAIARLVDALEARPDAGAVGAVVHLPSDATPFQRQLAVEVPRIVLPADAADPVRGLPTGACLAVWRDAYWAVGGFDDGLTSGEDVAFCLALQRSGRPTWIHPGAAVLHGPPTDWMALWRKFHWYGRGQRQLAVRHGFGGHRRWVRFAPLALLYALGRLAIAPLHALVDWRGGAPRLGWRPRRAWASAAAGMGFGWEAVAGSSAGWRRWRARLAGWPVAAWPGRILGALARRWRRGWAPSDWLQHTEPDALAAGWRSRATPLLVPTAQRAEAVALMAEHHPAALGALFAAAEQAHARTFGYFGWGERPVVRADGAHVDWHLDPASGHRFPADVPAHAVAIPVGRGMDIKAPWETSRGQHLVTLAQAAVAARFGPEPDEAGWRRHGARALDDVDDWVAQNPVGRGVNWACPMDVAIRAANWCVVLSLLADHPSQTDDRLGAILAVLVAHGRWIRSHLERGAAGNTNHYLADLAGLSFLGATLPGAEPAEWLGFARREWEREVPAQFGADGGHCEASTLYHRLALELAAASAQVSAAGGAPFAPATLARLRDAFAFAVGIADPSGRLPAIGDDDSGRLHVLDPSADPRDATYLGDWGARLCDDPALRWRDGAPAVDTCWRFGATIPSPAKRPVGPAPPTAFPDFGAWVLRAGDWWVLARAAPKLARGGGHAHNDQLAVSIRCGATALVVDPGTGCYTPDPPRRNAFRSVAAHATVQIDGREPRPIPGDCFALGAGGPALVMNQGAADGHWAAEHYGYGRLAGAPTHRRLLQVGASRVEIRDLLIGGGRHAVVVRFPLAPGIVASAEGDRVMRLRAGDEAWQITVSAGPGSWRVRERLHSPGYGRVMPATCVEHVLEVEFPAEITFTMRRCER